jgi:HSP20 family protein
MLIPGSFLNGEIDRFFRDFAPRAVKRATAVFSPVVQVREEADKTIVVADLPGVKVEDVKLTVENGILTLAGVRKERGEFERRFQLPTDIDAEKIEASHADGVLTIVIPKRAEARPRTIEIKR